MVRIDCRRHTPVLLLWSWVCIAVLPGFALFAVLLFWLEEAVELSPSASGAAATVFSAVFLVGRLGLGAGYDRVGARAYAVFVTATNIVLHGLLAAQQALPLARTSSGRSMMAVPLLLLLLFCNAGTVTSWGPLTLDLLGAQGKLVMPYMVTSLSAAQALGSTLLGGLTEARGPADALLPYALAAGAANVLGAVLLWALLRLLTVASAGAALGTRMAAQSTPACGSIGSSCDSSPPEPGVLLTDGVRSDESATA